MSRGAWRYQTVVTNTRIVEAFCTKYDLKLKRLNDGYQLRIEGVLDVYPVRAKYHNLRTGQRGEWTTENDLRKLMLAAIPAKQSLHHELVVIPDDDVYQLSKPQFTPKKSSWWEKVKRLFNGSK